MSYDLTLLDLDRAMSRAEVEPILARVYEAASRRDSVSPRLERFLTALHAEVPLELGDDHPWSMEPVYAPEGVGLLMVWSSVPELPELIEDLAIDHGLAIYNPQGFTKNTGAYLRQAPYLKLDCGMGYPALNPRSEVLHSALDKVLDGEFEFAILSRKSGDYIQMAPDEDGYVIEWQEGGLDNHWQGFSDVTLRLKQAFDDFANGGQAYRTMYNFEKLDL